MEDKHIRLRGKHNDIYFFTMRVPTALQPLLKKKSYNISLDTSDIRVARAKRDDILKEIEGLKKKSKEGEYRYFLDNFNKMDKEELEHRTFLIEEELSNKYPHLGHFQDKRELPRMSETEKAEWDAIQVAKGKNTPESRKLTLLEAKRLNSGYKNYTPKTVNAHDNACKYFLEYLKVDNIPIQSIKRKDVKYFISSMVEASQGSVKKHVGCLSQIWQYASDEEETELRNPFKGHPIKVKSTHLPYLAWDVKALREVLSHIDSNLDKLAVYIGWYTGARLAEVLSIRPDDIYIDKDSKIKAIKIKPVRKESEYIDDWDRKVKNEYSSRMTPVHKDLEPLLDGFNGWGGMKPTGLSKIFNRAKVKVVGKNKQYAFHSLRKNASTNLMNANVPEMYSARMLGHSITGLTMTYGLYAQDLDLKLAKESIDKIPKL